MDDIKNQTDENLSLDAELMALISRNIILRLLIQRKYFWFFLAILLAIGYWIVGLLIANRTSNLIVFLQYRQVYVLLISIVAIVFFACWYPPILTKVFIASPRALEISRESLINLIKGWMKPLYFPIPFSIGIIVLMVGLLIGSTTGLLAPESDIPNWLAGYRILLNVVVAIMFGGGLEVFILTIYLFHKLFQFKIKLYQYHQLGALGTLSAGLTTAGLTAVALFILMVFEEITTAALIISGILIIISIFMFTVPQFSYHSAMVNAKRMYLIKIGDIYEKNYSSITLSSRSTELTEIKESIEAIEGIEKNINYIPTWLINLSNIMQVIVSLLIPIVSLAINVLLSTLPYWLDQSG